MSVPTRIGSTQGVLSSNADFVAAQLGATAAKLGQVLRLSIRESELRFAGALENEVKSLTPVITGALRDSTTVDMSQGKMVVRQTATNKGFAYGPAVVFGHRIVTRGGIDTGRRTQPNPYPREAYQAVRKAFKDELGAQAVHGMRLLKVAR